MQVFVAGEGPAAARCQCGAEVRHLRPARSHAGRPHPVRCALRQRRLRCFFAGGPQRCASFQISQSRVPCHQRGSLGRQDTSEARTGSRTSASRERNGGVQDPSRQIGTLLLYLTEARVHRMEPWSTPRAEPQMSLNPTTQYLLTHECPSIGIAAIALPPGLVRRAAGSGAVQRRKRLPTARRASERRGSLAAVPLAGGVASRVFSSRSLWGVQ